MHGVGLPGVHEAGLGLKDRALRPPKAELWPAGHQLAGVENLVVEAVLLEGGDVALDVAGAYLLRVPSGRILDDQAAGL